MRFRIRDLLWLMVLVGLACVAISQARQLYVLQADVKNLNAQTVAQKQEIHDLKGRELALIRAVEQKYGERISEWKLWPDPDRPSQWRAELESQP
jgi:hypothetical protein